MALSKETAERIKQLKKEKNALILAHNYQPPEVQDIADILGDSLALSTEAARLKADIIVFCGVNFMAETAKILSPDKLVIHPEPLARCPMADMVDVQFLKEMQARHPDAVTVSYVNTMADVKAESDVCCTSGNALKVIKSLDEKKIIFTPDRNLGMYVQRFVPDKEIILWPGFCAVHHNKITVSKLEALKSLHPDAEVLAHPECIPEVIDYADFTYSTHGMLVHAQKSDKREFILGTEKEMAYRMSRDIPEKKFYAVGDAVCQNMKRITLEKVMKSLETLSPAVEISPDILSRAKIPLERMVEIGRG
jgi:quinolinate synthase